MDDIDDPLDLIPCGFLRLAESGGGAILRTNATFLAMLGYGAGELEGRGMDAVLSDEARSFWQTDFLSLLALRGEAEGIHLSLLDKQGEPVPVLVNAVRREIESEAILDCICVRRKPRDHDSAMEITERRTIDAKLRASEAEFRAAFEQSSLAIAQICAKTRRFLRVNPKFCELTGYSAEELAGMTPADITFAEDRDTDAALVTRCLGDEIPAYENKKRYVRKDGQIVWAHVNATILRDDEGRPERTMAVIQDITESKRAEEQLHQMERHYRALAVASSEIAYRMSADWSTLLPLDGRQLVASSDQPLADWAWLDQNLPREEHPRVRQAISDAIAGKTLFELEHRLRLPDGSIGWTLSRAVPILDENEAVTAWFGAASDITVRKRAEEALRENAAVFSTLIAQAPMGTYVLDAQLRMRQINAHAMPAFATVHPLIGRDFQEVVEILWGPEVGGPILRVFRNTLETGERYISPPFTEKRHDLGIEQTYEWETQRVTLPEGQHGVVCYFHEVTERAQATEALRASQERMRLAAEATRVGIWEWNVVTNAIRWDALMFRIYGIEPTPDGFVHYEDWSGAVLPEDLTANEAILQDTVRRAGQSSREFRIRRRSDGECRHIQAVETVRKNSAGQTEWVVGTNLDVTESNLAERVIQLSELRYRRLFEAAEDGVLLLDPKTRKITDANPSMTTLLGYTHSQLVGKELFEIGLLKDELASQEMFEKLKDKLQVRYEDLPLESREGKRQEVEVVANLYDENGHVVIQCNIRDITERKRAEEALHASEGRFRVLAESVPQFIWVSDTEGVLEYINPQWTEYTGLSLAQTSAHQDESVYHPDDISGMYAAWEKALRASASYSVEVRIRRAQDGIFRWFLTRGIPQYDTAGTVIRWFGVTTDIEDQKQAQARSADRNTLLQRAVAESHHRIKNNLQVLSALVELQVPLQGDTVPVSELKRIGQHIRTLAALHDLLTLDSKTGVDLDTVSLKAALEKLAPILQVTSGERKILIQTDEMVISLKQGGSFTLLVNELVSNALKHGKGDVQVSLTLLPEHTAQLEVCDDGPGFPPGFDPLKSANTGIELIESMGRWDLRGEILYQNRPTGGACVIITFPLAAEQSSAGTV
ncbi:PAS domain S-box protein [Armatimonas sp.]|uniref:PAS domain S-box protein n=1 Tax=Armatimonas sp. TaxID=1872638 RepID=UPI00374CB9A3